MGKIKINVLYSVSDKLQTRKNLKLQMKTYDV